MKISKFVYHASANKEIEVFEPRNISVRDLNEGPVVFATPDKAYATCFMLPSTKRTALTGRFNSDPWYFIFKGSIDDFKKIDIGGKLYTLNADSFISDNTKNMYEFEFISREPVKPILGRPYDSALEAMVENGVKVYFTSESEWNEIIERNDHGYNFMQNHSAYKN